MKETNKLKKEKSLYLRQHADNPVYWYPWGQDAFDDAKKMKKPIMLSIGYSACHWCHVMAHESFEDQETADILNSSFINIKSWYAWKRDSFYLLQIKTGWAANIVFYPRTAKFVRSGVIGIKDRSMSFHLG